jgi:hypothetical protein
MIFNPIAEVSKANLAHGDDGEQNLILGVASPTYRRILGVKVLHSGGLKTVPNQDLRFDFIFAGKT